MNNHFMKRGRNQRRRQGGGPNPNRALDSNGPDVRIRGTAQQIYDKYLALARDAQSSGDRVKAENYLQHAEHYFRVLRSVQGAAPVSQFDQNQDGDLDGDQPGVSDQRDRQQQSFGGDDQGDGDAGQDDQPEVAAYGDDRGQEPRQDQRPQHNNNQNAGQNAGPNASQNGGDHESRRRRRRPRRNREDGGAPAEEGAGADQDVEPVSV